MRRAVLLVLTVPALASVLAAATGLVDLDASIAVLATAILALLAVLADVLLKTLEFGRDQPIAFANDDSAVPAMARFASETRPSTAMLLEYSAKNAIPLLSHLANNVTSTKRLRLLVADPAAALSVYQRDYRLAEALHELAYRIPAEKAVTVGLQIKCYSELPSLRGRLLGDGYITVGWYTFDDRGLDMPGQVQMAGGSNPLIGAGATDAVGTELLALFTKTFENLWSSARQLGDAWEPFRDQPTGRLPTKEWFDAVRAPG